MEKIKYNIYPSILDKFQNYLDAEQNFNRYGENSGVTFDEYMRQSTQELLDAINRVPFESEAANRGTAFNEIVDAMIKGNTPDTSENGEYIWQYKNDVFFFPAAITDEFANYYRQCGAISQVYCEAVLQTSFGAVKLYGYIDELTPLCVHDIKTCRQYTRGKYGHKWQKYVYPYCMNESGNAVDLFEYNVTDFKQTYTEEFNYNHERDTKVLRDHVERFIMFLEVSRKLIYDRKIFNFR